MRPLLTNLGLAKVHNDPVLQAVAQARHVVAELVVARLLVVGARARADLLLEAPVQRLEPADLVVAFAELPLQDVPTLLELLALGVADVNLGAQQPQLRVGAQELLVQARVLGLPERGRLALILGQQLHLPRELGLELDELPLQLGDPVVLLPELLGGRGLLLPGGDRGIVLLADGAGDAYAIRVDAPAAASRAAIVVGFAAVIVGARRGRRGAGTELRARRRGDDAAAVTTPRRRGGRAQGVVIGMRGGAATAAASPLIRAAHSLRQFRIGKNGLGIRDSGGGQANSREASCSWLGTVLLSLLNWCTTWSGKKSFVAWDLREWLPVATEAKKWVPGDHKIREEGWRDREV